MSQSMPIKLSGELVEEARHSAKLFHRSLTGQIEHWAVIGRVIESQMSGDSIVQLLERVGGTMKIARVAEVEQRRQVAAVLAEFLAQSPETVDHSWLNELSARGVPLYGTTAVEPGRIVRREPVGAVAQAAR
jgi:hypothetical protein